MTRAITFQDQERRRREGFPAIDLVRASRSTDPATRARAVAERERSRPRPRRRHALAALAVAAAVLIPATAVGPAPATATPGAQTHAKVVKRQALVVKKQALTIRRLRADLALARLQGAEAMEACAIIIMRPGTDLLDEQED